MVTQQDFIHRLQSQNHPLGLYHLRWELKVYSFIKFGRELSEQFAAGICQPNHSITVVYSLIPVYKLFSSCLTKKAAFGMMRVARYRHYHLSPSVIVRITAPRPTRLFQCRELITRGCPLTSYEYLSGLYLQYIFLFLFL